MSFRERVLNFGMNRANGPIASRLVQYEQAKDGGEGAAGTVITAVIVVVIFAALITTVLQELNTAATNATIKSNPGWTQTTNLIYVIGLLFIVGGVAVVYGLFRKEL